jgi:hypothetical protein
MHTIHSIRYHNYGRMFRSTDVVGRSMRVLGGHLAIQSNDLHAGHALVEAPDYTDFINSYSGRVITAFEMRGGSKAPFQVMGAAGNPPLALTRSIDKGMAPNKTGQHVNYLEIYEGDVLPNDMQPVLEDAASLFPQGHLHDELRTKVAIHWRGPQLAQASVRGGAAIRHSSGWVSGHAGLRLTRARPRRGSRSRAG